MKALQILAPRSVRIVDIEYPHPKEDEIVVRLEYAAICNQNDYKIFYGLYGDLIKYPMEPGAFGHEGVGIVVEIGKGVKDFKIDDRVIMMKEGGPMLYREYVLRAANSVVKIKKDISSQEAAILELFGCAYHCICLLDNIDKKEIAVVGLGPAGLAILQILKLKNPKKIIGIEISNKRAEESKKLGTSYVVDPSNSTQLQELIKTGVDLVIDCTGVPQSILNSFEITRREVIIFGFTNQKFEVDQSKWFHKEMIIRNSKVQTIDDLKAVVSLLETMKISTKEYISGIMKFTEYEKAVEKIYKKEAIKILLEW